MTSNAVIQMIVTNENRSGSTKASLSLVDQLYTNNHTEVRILSLSKYLFFPEFFRSDDFHSFDIICDTPMLQSKTVDLEFHCLSLPCMSRGKRGWGECGEAPRLSLLRICGDNSSMNAINL